MMVHRLRVFAVLIMTWVLVGLFLPTVAVADTIVAWGAGNPLPGRTVRDVDVYNQRYVAVLGDGSLMTWGLSGYAMTGEPDGVFETVAAGGRHSVALAEDGSLAGWGENDQGQLDLPAGSDFVQVDAGQYHCLALREDGSLAAWGSTSWNQGKAKPGNDFAQVACGRTFNIVLKTDGSLDGWGYNSSGQTDVPSGNDYAAVDAGWEFAIALKTDGSLIGWGDNSYGQCLVPAGTDYVAISAGKYHGLAMRSDGSLVGWGRNELGQTDVRQGDDYVAVIGGNRDSLAIRSDGSLVSWGDMAWGQSNDVPTENDYVAVAGGGQHSVALTDGGEVVCWGDNSFGQCDVPIIGQGFAAVTAGELHTVGILDDGTLAAWGSDALGQCDVPAGSDFQAVSAGALHSLALKDDGTLIAWGDNSYYQRSVPDDTDFVAIAAGGDHNLALKADGTVVAWGANDLGQVTGIPQGLYQAIAAGSGHSLAIRTNGTLEAWGDNLRGQCDVPGGNNYVAVYAGAEFSAALRSDGIVATWGDNSAGQLNSPEAMVFSGLGAGNAHLLGLVMEMAALQVTASPSAGGTVSGSGVFEVGAERTVSATANEGWSFLQWQDGNTQAQRIVTVPAGGATYTATFEQDAPETAELTVSADPESGGTVTGSGTYTVGSEQTITATANDGWSFIEWQDGNTEPSRLVTVPAGGADYIATFEQDTATLTVVATPEQGGQVTGSGTYTVGSEQTISATANPGWSFVSWQDAHPQPERVVTVPAGGATYTATFQQDTPETAELTVLADPQDGGQVTGGGTYPVGSEQTITAMAAEGWGFAGWQDEVMAAQRTVTIPAGGATYTASFDPCDPLAPSIGLDTESLDFGAAEEDLEFRVRNDGDGVLCYTVELTSGGDYFQVDPCDGSLDDQWERIHTVTVTREAIPAGELVSGELLITDPNADNSPRTISLSVAGSAVSMDELTMRMGRIILNPVRPDTYSLFILFGGSFDLDESEFLAARDASGDVTVRLYNPEALTPFYQGAMPIAAGRFIDRPLDYEGLFIGIGDHLILILDMYTNSYQVIGRFVDMSGWEGGSTDVEIEIGNYLGIATTP